MKIRPITLKEAKVFIKAHHRHNKPPTGWKFGIKVVDDDENTIGVATVGRPISREIQSKEPLTLEINRTCTDGSSMANGKLYGACRQIAKAMGYTRIITYTQADESGASLRGAGFVEVKKLEARKSWAESSGAEMRKKRDPIGNGGVERVLWEVRFDGAV